jgi:hypothetical protein
MTYCDHCGEGLEEGEAFCGACGTQVSRPPENSNSAAPGYQLEAVVGSGSSGTVYLAHDTDTGDPVAVKVLDPALAAEPDARAHLAAEARTLARLRHPNVVGVYEYRDDPEPAVVMEYVAGTSLRQVLTNATALTAEQSLGVLSGALAGLGAAHAAGLVHGDIKPENILVDPTGVSKLTDFGQTVARGSVGRGGTPTYMSPEAFRGAALDERSDIYSLGVVLFECLAGRPPFVAGNDAALAVAHAQSPPPLIDGLPEPVGALLDRALAKDPSGRPRSADQFAAELEAAASSAYGPAWARRASIAALVGGLGGAGIGEAVAAAATGAHHGVGASATAHPAAHQAPVAAKGLGAKLGATKLGAAIEGHKVVSSVMAVLLVGGAAVGGVAAAGGGGTPPPSPPPPPLPKPVPIVHGGQGVVSEQGTVGPLRFGVSTQADVERFAGTPDATNEGTWDNTHTPFKALGYQCSGTENAGARPLPPSASLYCMSVYYVNANVGTLAGFETSSPVFSTRRGTTAGMSMARAELLEGRQTLHGCLTGIWLGDPYGSPANGGPPSNPAAVFIGAAPGVKNAASGVENNTVGDLEADSTTRTIGLFAC